MDKKMRKRKMMKRRNERWLWSTKMILKNNTTRKTCEIWLGFVTKNGHNWPHFSHQPSHNGQIRFWNMTTVISTGIRSQWHVSEIFLGSRFWAARQMWLFIVTNMWLVLVIIIWLHLVSFFNSMTKMSWNVVLITWLPVVAEYDRDDYN